MNYRIGFEKCFTYIEVNLKEDLTVSKLANEMGYTVYHFCRIFYAYQGMTPMEYVRSRRLQAALRELSEGRKIIEIAYDYRFETPSGFSKAFKNKYGMTPLQMKRGIQEIQNSIGQVVKDFPITYVIKELEEFYICGYCKEMDFNSAEYACNMIAYWESYDDENIEECLYEELNPTRHAEIGIVIRDCMESTKHKYLLGVIVSENNQDTKWYSHKIAKGRYAVITCPPVDMSRCDIDLAKMVKAVWKYIWSIIMCGKIME